jgi:hypothetical protein
MSKKDSKRPESFQTLSHEWQALMGPHLPGLRGKRRSGSSQEEAGGVDPLQAGGRLKLFTRTLR